MAKQDLFRVKRAESSEKKSIIMREMALLKLLEGKLSYRIPFLDRWSCNMYWYSYREILGVTVNAGLYWGLSMAQKSQLASDIATFAYELHRVIPVDFAQAIGFTVTSWPLSFDILNQYIPKIIHDIQVPSDSKKMQVLFDHFLELYIQILTQPCEMVLLHHDLHGKNILVHQNTGNLHGVIDFEDAAIGDPYQEFRLLYEIDSNLMEETVFFYAQMARKRFDVQRVHAYYLATEYSRLVEIFQGKKSNYTVNKILTNLMLYAKKYW